jgi:Na+:H+ antiporter, NhaA family
MSATPDHASGAPIPERPIERITTPFTRFLHLEAASGVLLLLCTVVALAFANSPLAGAYQALWAHRLVISVGSFELAYPLWYWVNDGLMTLFFFVIGLEIKRELVHGELRDPRSLALPLAGAVGGAAAPVIFFLLLLGGEAGRTAWAVPMATDIAFVVGCLALLGPRVPHGLKILMLSLAIVDDILAVLVIAFFYTAGIKVAWLGGALAGFGVVAGLNRLGVRAVSAYVLIGAVIWLCTLKSGLHPTVAGVALGLLTPASAWLRQGSLLGAFERALASLRGAPTGMAAAAEARETVAEAVFVAREAVSPLERLEHALHPWVAFGVMPIFALANAGVEVGVAALTQPLSLAIAGGLAFGKPLGITLALWLLVRAGLGRLPPGTTWPMIAGAGALAGIGFTMALFVAALALDGGALAVAKGGVLLGSAASLLAGMGLLNASFGRSGRREAAG